jgi:outer membrane autotransporter protein
VTSGTLALADVGSIAQSSQVVLSSGSSALDISGTTTGATVNNLSGVAGAQVALGSQTLAVNSTVDTTYAGAISGSGGLSKNGNSTLTLNGLTAYTGATRMNAGSLVLDGTEGGANLHSNVIAQSGTYLVIRNGASLTGWIDPTNVSIGSGSVWNVTNNSLVDNLVNDGLINFQAMQNGVGKTLTMQGAMSGAGTISMNAQLGGAMVHDEIVVSSGHVSGNQAILVNNADGQGSNAPIRLVRVTNGGTVAPSAFRLANSGGKVTAGMYDYYLTQGDSASIYNQILTPSVNASASLGVPLVVNAAQAYGENLVPSVDALDVVAKDDNHLWMRSLYNQYKNAESGAVDSTNQMYGIQIGKDLHVSQSAGGGSEKLGVYLAYGEQSSRLYGQIGNAGKVNQGSNALVNQSVGGYFMKKLSNDFYASTVLQATRYGATSSMVGGNTLYTTGFGFLGSLEIGQPFEIYSKQLTVTPEAQVVVQQIQLNDSSFNGTNVHYSNTPIWTSRLGIKLATESEADADGLKSKAWMTMNAYSTDGAAPTATFSSASGLMSSVTASKLAGFVGGIQVGASGDLTKSWSGTVVLNYLQGMPSSPVGLGLGGQAVIKYRF